MPWMMHVYDRASSPSSGYRPLTLVVLATLVGPTATALSMHCRSNCAFSFLGVLAHSSFRLWADSIILFSWSKGVAGKGCCGSPTSLSPGLPLNGPKAKLVTFTKGIRPTPILWLRSCDHFFSTTAVSDISSRQLTVRWRRSTLAIDEQLLLVFPRRDTVPRYSVLAPRQSGPGERVALTTNSVVGAELETYTGVDDAWVRTTGLGLMRLGARLGLLQGERLPN
mmetsp:Transcript_9731/g.35648  ORF Transcript_9731/g.35648 Transcript_9731/m.35648 type:complete len:224 (-) Transcript_9731:161-832(-)